ncbi:hypothetical protein IGS68_32035 (plasmid) [Skermanella sp. TT6]|uniref:Uncharacterized protein n=1 Tax=Skermanella cutis TaxID=2775420 RepID=A0ABX7BIS5_9PROT|nr:hypothetical protein [Skermanella sp. TT6]QQP93651.1 hypothetical protein IGS68_32035 [Skermanella sp. TT6]
MLTDAPIEIALLVFVATMAATALASVMHTFLAKGSAPEFARPANSNDPAGLSPSGTRRPNLRVVA